MYEGLRVASAFLNALCNLGQGGSTVDNQFASSVGTLNAIIYAKLERVNIDTEVKHSCLLTASSLICTSYPILGQSELSKYFAVFKERMTNELTREAALRGLTVIASNNLQEESSSAVIPIAQPQNFLDAFFDLLKKQSRQLHLNTLECLEALTRRYAS